MMWQLTVEKYAKKGIDANQPMRKDIERLIRGGREVKDTKKVVTTHRWHFSVRDLLLLTTLVSFVLLIAVKWFPIFLVASFWILYLAGFSGALYVTSAERAKAASAERPKAASAERPKAAIAAWFLSGASLIGMALFNLINNSSGLSGAGSTAQRGLTILVSVIIGGVGLVGFYRAWQTFSRAKSSPVEEGRDKHHA